MTSIRLFFNKTWKINLLLLICSFSIYAFYYYPIFININSVLSSITGDALKNYYTFSYHIKNDRELLHFSGMNFPFGEHVVFTDCQPILTFLLRLLPFTHDYLIGILHALLFTSYIITPLILNKILLRSGIDTSSAFFTALAITVLSPQFAKINGGHHALAYGCIIPFSVLLVTNFIYKNSLPNLLKLMLYNLILFFLHPYMGFSASLFSFLALALYYSFTFHKTTFLKNSLNTVSAGLAPLFAFQLFMKLSDQHSNRTLEPHGNKTLVENFDTLLAPDFGPFKLFLETIFSHKTTHLEGHSYLGLFTIILSLLFIISILFLFKKLVLKKEMVAIFISSFLLLLISFGWHLIVLDVLHIKSASLNQFRATSRFAWFFYYTLPLFIVPVIYQAFKKISPNTIKLTFPFLAFLYLSVNLWEANYYFQKDKTYFWKFRNLLNEKFLNQEEKGILAHIISSKNQAILPLPMFYLGSEMYDRVGADNSMIPAMLYSYHSGLPIVGGAMSRTSISETAEAIELLNSYKENRPVMERISDNPFLIIKTKDPLLSDEDRLLTDVKMFYKNDSIEFGEINKPGLLRRKIDSKLFYSHGPVAADSNNIIHIPYERKKPFLKSRMLDYETISILDSNKIKSGSYIVSFHYHYTRQVYTSLDMSLIITKGKGKEYAWQNFQRISLLSGFYPGFAVMEYKVDLEKDSRYEFILNGTQDLNYYISHFMLRPEGTTVITKVNNDSLFNNFPK